MITIRGLLPTRGFMIHLLTGRAGASFTRLMADWFELTCRGSARRTRIKRSVSGWLPHQPSVEVSQRSRSLPMSVIAVVSGPTSVRPDACHLGEPAVAITRQEPLGEPSPVVKDPASNCFR